MRKRTMLTPKVDFIVESHAHWTTVTPVSEEGRAWMRGMFGPGRCCTIDDPAVADDLFVTAISAELVIGNTESGLH